LWKLCGNNALKKINLKTAPIGAIPIRERSFGMKDADDETVSVLCSQQKQIAGDCARYLQSVYLSGARTNLIFDLLVKMSDAANRASGLTIKLAAEATGLSEEEAYRCIRGIVSFTGDPIVMQDGQKTWLYQNYEPRSIGGAAQGLARLLPKVVINEAVSRSRKRPGSSRRLAVMAAAAT
jgi:hypothetical protein